MKRKIIMASFFVSIILLAQIVVVSPSVVADDGDDSNDIIKLSDNELVKFPLLKLCSA